eukprot:CAMPEP_0178897016 /NCGR_PEP_ID=MMETSP0786-20121207/1508_1 /TAXON_ID=186022 /ORGANISM="Thalassionema frauenfeldii, Strain CCMP 1798" /LENGTH=551 /DNA_ID=CAMNT_0020567511 /DNA_START=44 /DNA_END=1695 /DNA_ORIENTATION=-
MGRDEETSNTDGSEDNTRTIGKKSKRDEREKKRRKKERKRKRKRRSEGRKKSSTRKRDYSSSNSDSESTFRKHRKRKKNKQKKDRKRRKEATTQSGSVDHLQRNHAFANALLGLVEDHFMLIQMAGGRSFNLSQMTDASVARGLEGVFESLAPFGVECRDNIWLWKPPATTTNKNNDLLLVKVAKTLLDGIGVTMEAVEKFGQPLEKHQDQSKNTDDNKQEPTISSSFTPLQDEMLSLLDRFIQKDSTLPQQMGGICEAILDGESIAIDGLPDKNLQQGLESIFRGAGLEYTLMESDKEGDDSDSSGEELNIMGYALSETNDDFARRNIQSILDACNDRAASIAKETPRRSMKGPLPEHMAGSYPSYEQEEDLDDDDGPLPAGVNACRHGLSSDVVNALSKEREEQMEMLDPNATNGTKPGEREEWMVNPGEHDLLQNIKSGTMKNRSFENKKGTCRPNVLQPEAIVHPSMQAEVDAIMEAHNIARGPSLMEQHRENKAMEKALKASDNSNKSFNWSREKHLDADRRVDKDALKLLMGGASGQLKDKFQGG